MLENAIQQKRRRRRTVLKTGNNTPEKKLSTALVNSRYYPPQFRSWKQTGFAIQISLSLFLAKHRRRRRHWTL